MAKASYLILDSKANKIISVADPTNPQDAATKAYVDGLTYMAPETDALGNTSYGTTTLPATTGTDNTAIGKDAGKVVAAGARNTVVGKGAGASLVGALNNTLIGVDAGKGNWYSNHNTHIGYDAQLYAAGTGQYTTGIGVGSRAHTEATALGATAQAQGTRSVAVGFGAVATLNNQIMLGTVTENVYVPGLLKMGLVLGTRIHLYDNLYGIGIEPSELVQYVGSAGGESFSWRTGSTTGTEWARLNQSGLQIKIGNLTLLADPVSPLQATTKQYVDVNFAPISHTHPSTTDFRWTYDAPSTMADPGIGKIRTDTASGVPSTQAALSDITELGVDASATIQSLTVGDLIYFQQLNNADNWGRYTVDGTPVNNGTWWLIPIKAVEQHGAAIAKNQDVLVRFTYGGGGGAGGIGGIEIFAQPAAPGVSTTDIFWLDVDDTSVQNSQFWRAWKGTQAAYDAISTKDQDTLYVVNG